MTVGDYVMQQHGVQSQAPLPCVADWDSVSYTSTVPHCLRRIDTNRHYPEDAVGGVHTQALIWSRALWDIRNGLGSYTADHHHQRAVLFADDTSFADAAVVTVDTARDMYGDGAAAVV